MVAISVSAGQEVRRNPGFRHKVGGYKQNKLVLVTYNRRTLCLIIFTTKGYYNDVMVDFNANVKNWYRREYRIIENR